MAETALITIAEVQEFRKIDSNYKQNKFDTFVMEAQRKNLRNLLGDALYYAFMNDARTSGIYKDLLDGKIYAYQGNNIEFYGLKPALIYWWLAIDAREGDLFHSTYGAIKFTNNPQQSFETPKEKERIAAGYMEVAQGYENDTIKFLNTYRSSYPLWGGNEEKNETNFVSFKV